MTNRQNNSCVATVPEPRDAAAALWIPSTRPLPLVVNRDALHRGSMRFGSAYGEIEVTWPHSAMQ